MRKALLYIKVVLFLATFVGASSSNAANAGNQSLLAPCAYDVNVSTGEQTNGDNDKFIVTETVFSFVQFRSSPVAQWHSASIISYALSQPSARAPPVGLSA